MNNVFDLRPFRNALDQLARSNHMELRKTAIGYVRDEQKAGRSGMVVAREIFCQRMATGARQVRA